MALSDYEAERADILHKGRPLISVRGLNLDDVSVLIRAFLPELQGIAETYKGKDVLAEIGNEATILKLVSQAPHIAASVIALAADEGANMNAARKLPIAVQMAALKEISRLTFEDVGGPKGFLALVMSSVRKELPPTPDTATGAQRNNPPSLPSLSMDEFARLSS